MKKYINSWAAVSLIMLIIIGCNENPKVISSSKKKQETVSSSSGIFDGTSANKVKPSGQNTSFTNNLHKVTVKEVLPTQKYVYLNVSEEGKEFWIAARKQEVKTGETYYYRGGLLKRNFESKEYNRVFDTIYLISSLVEPGHGAKDENKEYTSKKKVTIPTHTDKIIEHKGSIKISELVKDPKKFDGKTVQISAKCSKVNPNIMNRNWIHLKDGSKDDYDLVVTSNTYVAEGAVITIKAKVSIDRDFGAGYKYDLILEDAIIVQN